jgi:hypothetical protein
MIDEHQVRWWAWLIFTTLSGKASFRSALWLQEELVGTPQSPLAEFLINGNSFIVAVLIMIWLYKFIVVKK